MTVYYVSKQRGDDLNDGRSPSTPWASITKAVQTLVAGDTCYIGPGTYREQLMNPNAGTDGNLIQFIGDPDAQYVTGDNKGIVRVTACDEYEMESPYGTVWFGYKDYISLKNMLVDGGMDCVFFGNKQTCSCENVIAIGGGCFTGGVHTNCIALSNYMGFTASSKCINCISIAGQDGFEDCGYCINCLAIARYGYSAGTAAFNDTIINSIAIAGALAYNGVTSYNCMALGAGIAFYGGRAYNGLAILCDIPFQNDVHANDCKYTLCNVFIGGYVTDSGYEEPVQGPVMLWTFNQMQKVMEAFDPWMFEGAKQWGRLTDSSSNPLDLPGTDILGRARKMLGGYHLDIGPYAFSNVEPDFTEYRTNPPGIKIQQQGMKMFEIPATGGEEITVKVQVKYTNPQAGLPPRILLRGETITEQMAQYTAGSNVWQELTVSATPAKDEILTLVLYANDMGAGSVSYFSDIQVS